LRLKQLGNKNSPWWEIGELFGCPCVALNYPEGEVDLASTPPDFGRVVLNEPEDYSKLLWKTVCSQNFEGCFNKKLDFNRYISVR